MGVLAGLLMLVSLFLPVVSVDVARGSCEVINDSNPELAEGCVLSGFERHSVALLLLGALALLMAWGAGPGRSRPAAFALIGAGAIVLVLALASDLPASNETGAIGRNFEAASASPGVGLWLELIAGVLALAAGALALLAAARAEQPPRRRPPERRRPTPRRASSAAPR